MFSSRRHLLVDCLPNSVNNVYAQNPPPNVTAHQAASADPSVKEFGSSESKEDDSAFSPRLMENTSRLREDTKVFVIEKLLWKGWIGSGLFCVHDKFLQSNFFWYINHAGSDFLSTEEECEEFWN